MVPLDPQSDKYKQCLLAKGSFVWAALPHRVIVAKNLTQSEKMFCSAAIKMLEGNRNLSLLNQINNFCFCVCAFVCQLYSFMHVKSLSKYPFCSHDLCRYGTGQRPLLPFDPHLNVDINSSGESSSGFTSQESTIERCKTGISTFCMSSTVVIFFLPLLG